MPKLLFGIVARHILNNPTHQISKFSDEQTTGIYSVFFAGLTVFISCRGLFVLATYIAEDRVKEIGVRKVPAASVAGITAPLTNDLVRVVIIAIIIASPVARGYDQMARRL